MRKLSPTSVAVLAGALAAAGCAEPYNIKSENPPQRISVPAPKPDTPTSNAPPEKPKVLEMRVGDRRIGNAIFGPQVEVIGREIKKARTVVAEAMAMSGVPPETAHKKDPKASPSSQTQEPERGTPSPTPPVPVKKLSETKAVMTSAIPAEPPSEHVTREEAPPKPPEASPSSIAGSGLRPEPYCGLLERFQAWLHENPNFAAASALFAALVAFAATVFGKHRGQNIFDGVVGPREKAARAEEDGEKA